VILMITLVILVILATLGYTLTARVAARRHRDQYIIDYSQARYACVSALKYALTTVNTLQPQLISRPNEPDFSDLFAMSEVDYQKFMAQAAKQAREAQISDAALADESATKDPNSPSQREADGKTKLSTKKKQGDNAKKESADSTKKRRDAKAKVKQNAKAKKMQDANDVRYTGDANDVNDVNDLGAQSITIPGPYGPPWPLVADPVKCEIGSAKVKIEIEDENAKYPLNWAMLTDDKWKSLAETGFATFCEWMGYTADEIGDLRKDLDKIGELRPYQLEFKALATKGPEPPAALRSRVSRGPATKGTDAAARRTAAKAPASPAEQLEQQNADFGKLFHSSMVNMDLLSRPSIPSDTRNESAAKYTAFWVIKQVNVNSAPRHVLEAALTFGSAKDAPKIAGEIIRQRQVKPFNDIEELKKGVFRYSDSIDKCKDFLTTSSSVFTIRITAISGVAKATIIVAVSKEGNKVKQIGIVSD
jgi:hypothetical protein